MHQYKKKRSTFFTNEKQKLIKRKMRLSLFLLFTSFFHVNEIRCEVNNEWNHLLARMALTSMHSFYICICIQCLMAFFVHTEFKLRQWLDLSFVFLLFFYFWAFTALHTFKLIQKYKQVCNRSKYDYLLEKF